MGSTILRRLRLLCRGSLVLLFIVGCSGGAKIPRLLRVTGKVIYKEQPVAGAQIGFISKLDNKDVFSARGVTNDKGEFSLTTYVDPKHEMSGATPGEFVVTVTKVDKPDPKEVMANFSKSNPTMKGMFKQLIPPVYADAKRSTLNATVEEGEDNKFEFKLVD